MIKKIEFLTNAQSSFIEVFDSISEYLENEKNTEYTKEIKKFIEISLEKSTLISSALFSTYEEFNSFISNLGSTDQENLGKNNFKI